MTLAVGREQVLAFRARSSHLDDRIDSFVDASRGGLQDSVPRAGVISLYARARGVQPGSWDDPSLAQIWFRGGADYIVPRSDIGIFTLGCRPRDEERMKPLEELADRAHEVMHGRTLKVREVSEALKLEWPTQLRLTALTGRILIRWNASMIWLIGIERPDIDAEDARRELARRFLRWFGPQTTDRLAWWTGAEPKDAKATWNAIADELIDVEVEGATRQMLESDLDALENAAPGEGVRLIPWDDPYIKTDRDMLVPDTSLRDRLFPPKSLGYIPGAILVDGEIVGVWQRQQRKVTLHPWEKLATATRAAIDAEAFGFPIAAKTKASVIWD